MEVVTASPSAGGGVPPFHNHDVREWSRIDSLTGVLERARLETDHWTANTNNASHKYGKVVDSRARSGADGAVQQRAKRQLEVFQSQVPGGRLQVIKTHTVSSSRWTNKSPPASVENKDISSDFENLQLAVNPLDVSSQKSKASVGRSVGRRPPSRPRTTRDEITTTSSDHLRTGLIPFGTAVHGTTNLHRVSRLCHQIHENAVRQTFGNYLQKSPASIHDRQNGDATKTVETFEIDTSNTSISSNNSNIECKRVNGHTNLTRTKSTSSEDLHLIPERDKTKSTEDLEDLEQLQNWRRTSKIRRSLQFPKQTKTVPPVRPTDLPENSGNVRKIREHLETGRRLSTALRGNNVDLQALDQILQSITGTNLSLDKNGTASDDTYEEPEKDTQISVKKQKRNSFVTVESIQEVRGRLRRTSSPSSDIYQNNKKEEEADDGIVTEDSESIAKKTLNDNAKMESRVKSYVYGMENNFNKKSISGTGSLESRSKQYNSNFINRNEDWYNRRKSYGFEQVHNQQDQSISSKANKVESSTDSGICRSSEIVVVPTPKHNVNKSSEFSSESEEAEQEKSLFKVNKFEENEPLSNVKRFSSYFDRKDETKTNGFGGGWTNISQLRGFQNEDWKQSKDQDVNTITIPIGTKTSIFANFEGSNAWKKPTQDSPEIKRHSIAVDEYKYASKDSENTFRRTSLAINDKMYQDAFNQEEDDLTSNKKTKKVEFCKTEVHFAADCGKVNIVETDEKPPPTQNFRRRRRNTGLVKSRIDDFNKLGLPVLHFGDSSFEKSLFGIVDQNGENQSFEAIKKEPVSCTTVTINSNFRTIQDMAAEELKENIEEVRKGILKNKPVKPKPYLLGESEPLTNGVDINSQENRWGVKLKPVQKDEGAIWRSTVTVRNTFYDNQTNGVSDENHKENGVYGDFSVRENGFRDVLKENNIRENSYSSQDNSFIPGANGDLSDNSQTEFQKLLKTLKPASRKSESFCEVKRNSGNFNGIRIISPPADNRRASWSVDDRIKQVEDLQWSENKGYSTKVNIGEGEATVVENIQFTDDRSPTWPRRDDSNKDYSNSYESEKSNLQRTIAKQNKQENTLRSKPTDPNYSPVVFRKSYPLANKTALKTAIFSDKLSSPSLVASKNEKNPFAAKPPDLEIPKHIESELTNTIKEIEKQILSEEQSAEKLTTVLKAVRVSPLRENSAGENHVKINPVMINPVKVNPVRVNPVRISPTKLHPEWGNPGRSSPSRLNPGRSSPSRLNPGRSSPSRLNPGRSSPSRLNPGSVSPVRVSPLRVSPSRVCKEVLRQPKKSEMAYFGVPVSPESQKKSFQ